MREAVTSYVITKKKMPDGRIYESPRIYLSTKLTTDSSFPFASGALLHVRVAGKKLTIMTAPRSVLRKFGKLRKAKVRKNRRKLRARKQVGSK